MEKEVMIETTESYLRIALQGEITLKITSAMKENIKKTIEEKGQYQVIVDLQEVTFIDSSGLGMLISWFKLVNEHKGYIVYCGVHSYVEKLIGLVKLDKVFTIVPTTADAVRFLVEQA